jgi:mRNA interferase HigB
VRIIAKGTLRGFWEQNKDSEQPLKAWYQEAIHADLTNPQEIKQLYRNASIIGDNRVVFNIAGNKYRLIVKFNYAYRIGYIRYTGTHADYDLLDAEKV